MIDDRPTVHDHLPGAAAEPDTGVVFEVSADPIVVLDVQGLVLCANPAYGRLMGVPPGALAGTRPLVTALDARPEGDLLIQLRADGNPCHPLSVTTWVTAADGRTTWLEWRLVMDPATGLVHGVGRDIGPHLRSTEALREAATTDPLTGLPNRAVVREALDRALSVGRPLAVLYVDLDNFKPVNDMYGHMHGDRVLTAIARRIQAALREGDLAGRMGGDEFVVIVDGTEGAEALATRILDVVAAPVTVDGVATALTASIGICSRAAPLGTAEQLLAAADRALYAVKATGGGAFALA